MRRREFLSVLGGAAVMPLAVRAQQSVPVIGKLSSTSFSAARSKAFDQGLKEAGFIKGQNVQVEEHFAQGQADRMHALLATLTGRPVTLIVANSVAARAAKNATTIIPIVFTTGSDPVRDGLVAGLNRPGGNVTGATFLNGRLSTKRLDLLRQIVPRATTIGALINPDTPETATERSELQAATQKLGLPFHIMEIRAVTDLEPAFGAFVQRGVAAIVCGSGAFLFANRAPIVAFAARHAIPVIYSGSEAVAAGGLMSYSASVSDAFRQAGVYAGRILKGEKPADLPVVQSTKFEFVINLATAKALGLDVNPQLLATADELIE
jgi:putative ABC transport system substrate-binding protein